MRIFALLVALPFVAVEARISCRKLLQVRS
ncbi:MAG: hypothetical protein QOH65_2659 [Methylobacteriaceae bacterium]|jgi:hypothetical protein|nr:hypothetical protein [Methylobacteriaceae bacterium]